MFMHPFSLYLYTVLIWGSTFFAIKFQLGEVPAEHSIVYRFALASVILLFWCFFKRLPMRFSLHQHKWMLMQGVFLFGANYILVYHATPHLPSGLVAVVFSAIVLMNIANGALFLKRKVEPRAVVAAIIGLVGIALVFAPEFEVLEGGVATSTDQSVILGLGLSMLGTYTASLGNMISMRNQQAGLPVVQTNAYGMGYGALLLLTLILAKGESLVVSSQTSFYLSLGYLSVFGSILAFGSYLTLLGKIGPEKASYSMVLFPIVALTLSTLFEGYQWTPSAVFGVGLVLLGNLLIISHPKRLAKLATTRT